MVSHSSQVSESSISQVMRHHIVLASMVGTTIEFYDFYIYATAAVSVFPLLFFPKGDPSASLLASMATFGVAFIARPIGSIVFGHFGDRVGRKATLVGSLLMMGIATFLIGVLPTFPQVGILAAGLLTLLRFCQGLGLGGEWSGAALLVTETAVHGKRAWAAMWPQLGAPAGFILANGFFLILTHLFNYSSVSPVITNGFLTWGWRIPFLASLTLVALGLYIRTQLDETPVFAKALTGGKKLEMPLWDVVRNNIKELVLGTFIMLATYGLFYLMTTWVLSYAIGEAGKGYLGINYRNFLILQLISVLCFAGMIPVAAKLADHFGRRKVLLIVTLMIMIFGLTFRFFLDPQVMGTGQNARMGLMLVFLCLGMCLMGLSFGPMSAILPELFPTNVRYTGSGIAYNFSSILGAAVTPFAAVWICSHFGVGLVGDYLTFLGVLTLTALWMSPETKNRDLDNIQNQSAVVGIEITSP